MTQPIVRLDFDSIKAEIINYIKTNQSFTDYNFEGSALNAIIDILAYNTHTNAFYGNMIHNEGFIDTAQKRSSVVSRAKELGYTPRSSVCSAAYVDVTLSNVPPNTAIANIDRNTSFISTNDFGNYAFYTVSDYTPEYVSSGVYKFSNVKIVNGVFVSNYFVVNRIANIRSIFTIPNESVDTSTLRVFVRPDINSVQRTEYYLGENVYELDKSSYTYFLQESYDGFFQIYFGHDVLGTEPIDGNIIEIEYYITKSFNYADNCRLFAMNEILWPNIPINIATTQVSFGGSEKEPLESIKFNALKSNSAKERSVTTDDYSLILKEKFNFIKSAIVWGGEDNIPPVYGTVFISLQPVSGYVISEAVKNEVILPEIRKTSLLTIRPVFVYPNYILIELVTKIKYNEFKTTTSKSDLEVLIKSTISAYINSISTFDNTYINSDLISIISNTDPGIVSISLSKKIGFDIAPILGISTNYNKYIGNSIVPGSIRSNKFVIYASYYYIVNIFEIPGTYINNSVKLGLYTADNVLLETIGSVDLTLGIFDITVKLQSYIYDVYNIAIRFETVNDDVLITKNQILGLASSINNTGTLVVDDNIVLTEIYAK